MSAEDSGEVPPIRLSRQDFLVAENLSLKMVHMHNESVQLQAHVQQELRKINEETTRYRKEFEEHRQHCKAVYGVDIVEVEIAPDGTILGPKKAPPSPPIQLNR